MVGFNDHLDEVFDQMCCWCRPNSNTAGGYSDHLFVQNHFLPADNEWKCAAHSCIVLEHLLSTLLYSCNSLNEIFLMFRINVHRSTSVNRWSKPFTVMFQHTYTVHTQKHINKSITTTTRTSKFFLTANLEMTILSCSGISMFACVVVSINITKLLNGTLTTFYFIP